MPDVILAPFYGFLRVSGLFLAACSQVLVVSLLFYLLLQEHQVGLYGKLSYKGEKKPHCSKEGVNNRKFHLFWFSSLGRGKQC